MLLFLNAQVNIANVHPRGVHGKLGPPEIPVDKNSPGEHYFK